MKHETLEDDDVEELLELDRLVARELQAFKLRGTGSAAGKKSERRTNQYADGAGGDNKKQRPKPAGKSVAVLKHAQKSRRDEGDIALDLEGAAEEFEERLSNESMGFDVSEYNELMLSEDDEAFVNKTVEWLSQRQNKDMLMTAIWDRLTEFTPETFYSPENDNANEPSGEQSESDSQQSEGESHP